MLSMKGILLALCCIIFLGCEKTTTLPSKSSPETPTTPSKNTETDLQPTITPAPTPIAKTTEATDSKPNILFIIADDMGVDTLSSYNLSNAPANTPILNGLAESGITFDNAWATPMCTTTRATILTGLHGVHSGVTYVPAPLPASTQILQAYLAETLDNSINTAVFGKWHVGGGTPPLDHPAQFGVPYYAGNLSGNLTNYFDWELVINGKAVSSNEYHTTKITQLAMDWIKQQDKPWFAWIAYSAPHSPFHLPPDALHSANLADEKNAIDDNPRPYFLAAIEAIDTEVGRLLASLDDDTLDNTIVIFLGDNGSPRSVIDKDVFPASHGKKTLYEGGIRVPLIISGKKLLNPNRRSDALVHSVDLFATIAELQGAPLPAFSDSHSVAKLLFEDDDHQSNRQYNYSEFELHQQTHWAVRNARYKYIRFHDGTEALFDLTFDLKEATNLIDSESLKNITDELKNVGLNLRKPLPVNTTDTSINMTDIIFTQRSFNCKDYIGKYTADAKDIGQNKPFISELSISADNTHCLFSSNGIPNHAFNDGNTPFPHAVAEIQEHFKVVQSPVFADAATPLSLRIDNAILLNGVKVDVLAAGCFGVGNGKIGCNDDNQPWRYDPMHQANGFNVDRHNAHAQPDGAYHYHGPAPVLFNQNNDQVSGVIGFAADGFPIVGPYFNDGTQIRKAISSYRLKNGSRPITNNAPGGQYDGQFRDDYEFIKGLGDLDECNGMSINGQYSYFVTEHFPYLIGCFMGTPDASFFKR